MLLGCVVLPRVGAEPDASLHLYLLVGQSNMAGRGALDEESKKIDPRILMLTKELQWQPAANADPIGRLDVTGLQERLLAPLLGIDDPRTSKRIDFVGGIRGTGELVKRVDSGECAVAFSMFPTTLQQLMDIADADQIMPPKSTWFEPKLRSGLFIHTF